MQALIHFKSCMNAGTITAIQMCIVYEHLWSSWFPGHGIFKASILLNCLAFSAGVPEKNIPEYGYDASLMPEALLSKHVD